MSDSLANLSKPFDKIERISDECCELIRRERELRVDAENANHRKDEFLTVVAYKLRNTLHSSGGGLDIFRINPKIFYLLKCRNSNSTG